MLENHKLAEMTLDLSKVDADADLVSEFPQLANLPTFANCNRKDRNKLIRYILFMYDPKSPIIQLFPDIEKRKEFAANIAGYKDSDKIREKLFNFRDDDFLEMADEWIKSVNSRIWSMIVSNEQVFYEYQATLLQPIGISEKGDKDRIGAADLKSKLMNTCDEINDRLEGYYRKMYGDQETVEKVANRKRLSPENIGKQ